MSASKSRFGSLAQAIKDRTAAPEADTEAAAAAETHRPAGAGVHKPAAALNAVSETLRAHITRLETELAQSQTTNTALQSELERARSLQDKAGDSVEEFVFLDPNSIEDPLPMDRLRGRAEGREFDELREDIERNGQNDAITVRRTSGAYEVAAGRRRLEVCKRLQRQVLARVRDLDDQAMLRIQFSENERRSDISALERARWFAEVRDRLKISAKEIAAQFGVDPSTFSLYLRIARFPDEILERLEEPRRLAVIPARRVMEAIESDPTAVQRILDALDAFRVSGARNGGSSDPAGQIDILIRTAEGKDTSRTSSRSPVPDRRHIVHQGRRIGTLTRNGGQWIFRFATSIPDHEVHMLAERLAAPVGESAGASTEATERPNRK
jgi:ParB family transcriptional regulator, chromosome partitioning protein